MVQSPMVEEFLQLVQIDSASGKERGIADALKAKLSQIGLSVREDDTATKVGGNCGNLLAEFEGTSPGNGSIMFSAHMDRVGRGLGIKPHIESGHIVSDGTTILAADDLAGVCVILDALRRVKSSGQPHCRVEVMFTVCEESGLKGSRNFDYGIPTSKVCYVFDSGGAVGRIVNGAPTSAGITIDVHGKSAHAGNEPEKGVNALFYAAKILSTIHEGRLAPNHVANFAVCTTSTQQTNIVCDRATIRGETRSSEQETVNDYVAYVREHALATLAGTPATVEVTSKPGYPAMFVPENSPCITALKTVFCRDGLTCKVERGGGGMDANWYNAHGIESVGVAVGYRANHTLQEYLDVDEFLKAGQITADLIFEWTRLFGKK